MTTVVEVGRSRGGGKVRAKADAGRAAAAGVADGAAGRGRGGSGSAVAVVGGEWVQVHLVGPLLSCFALSLHPSGLVRLTRLLEVGLGWAQCLESPFGNQNAYDFVHFLQKIYLVHGMARGTLEAHGLRATAG